MNPPDPTHPPPLDLPPPPPGFHRLAWQGFSLAVPATWNMTFQRHESDTGAIALSDLHKLRLEIRWQNHKPRHVAPKYDRFLRRLARQKLEVTRASSEPLAHHVVSPKNSLLLLRGATRIYELAWPGQARHLPEILASFRDFAAQPTWTWQVYGVYALAPANYRLKNASLLPGATRLELVRRSRQVTLGAWSMAARLLGKQTLPEFAAAHVPLVRHNPHGLWRHTPPAAEFQTTRRRGFLLRPCRLTLKLLHDPAADAIRWTQTIFPASLANPPLVTPL